MCHVTYLPISPQGRPRFELSYHGNLKQPVEFKMVRTEKLLRSKPPCRTCPLSRQNANLTSTCVDCLMVTATLTNMRRGRHGIISNKPCIWYSVVRIKLHIELVSRYGVIVSGQRAAQFVEDSGIYTRTVSKLKGNQMFNWTRHVVLAVITGTIKLVPMLFSYVTSTQLRWNWWALNHFDM